jgi:hypothetical protein
MDPTARLPRGPNGEAPHRSTTRSMIPFGPPMEPNDEASQRRQQCARHRASRTRRRAHHCVRGRCARTLCGPRRRGRSSAIVCARLPRDTRRPSRTRAHTRGCTLAHTRPVSPTPLCATRARECAHAGRVVHKEASDTAGEWYAGVRGVRASRVHTPSVRTCVGRLGRRV